MIPEYPRSVGLNRSQQMSRIRGRDTQPELVIRRRLWAEGLRYRLHFRTPGGRADIAFPGLKVAVFIDGCFWHGCPEHYVRPRSSTEFWSAKLRANVQRDVDQTLKLENDGWRVCRVWEHEVFEHPDRVVRQIRRAIMRMRWAPEDCWRVFEVVEIDPILDRETRSMRELRGRECPQKRTQIRSTKKWATKGAPKLLRNNGKASNP